VSAALSSRAAHECAHCANPVEGRGDSRFCCVGCEAVHALLGARHLANYYALRDGRGPPIASAATERVDHKWLEPLRAKLREGGRVDLDIQGMHCTACVWLVERVFREHRGGLRVVVNPTVGRLDVTAAPAFDLDAFVTDVESFGYRLGPALKDARASSSGIVLRMGVCTAIAMNSMIFTVAIYAGLNDGPLFTLFHRLTFALSMVSIVFGGSVFFRSAWSALRRGVLHMDLPIALGIALAGAGSTYSFLFHQSDANFLDTLSVFIALMLVGRWLQERVLEKNRLSILASDGVDGLLARRVKSGAVATVKCTTIARGDVLLVAPGDLVPVDARTRRTEAASFSLDWINGESEPRAFEPGARVPAGSFLSGSHAVEIEAATDFADSALVDLLRTPLPREGEAARSAPFWHALAKRYVVAVLALASIGFGAWLAATGDVSRSLSVATAVLIVTCPCAFGIATPLAYDLVQAGLRRAGLFVRSPGFLDRAAQVKTVVFDKTGTVTSGALMLTSGALAAIGALGDDDRRALGDLALRSHHPKSAAVRVALGSAAPYDESAVVIDHAGLGVELVRGAARYRLGAPFWSAPGAALSADVVFSKDGALLADLAMVETSRHDAAREVRELSRAGYDVWLLSGDAQARVDTVAREVGIAPSHAIGDRSPEGKSAWVAEHDRKDLLMVGDGINDSLVVASAFCSGTPSIDRPFMAARSDFYFVSPGLRPVRLALRASLALARIRRANLVVALAYNAVAVTLAYAGLMSPLLCAVFMPVSSLTTIAVATISLSGRSALWRS
jgi:Cu2+-exporting ATPase